MINLEILENLEAYSRGYNLEIQCGPEGDTNSTVAIIGEYPGANEVSLGRPFVGGAGKLLWDKLRPHKIDRSQVYCTNVVKRAVSVKSPTSRVEQDEWIDLLMHELSLLPNLTHVLILGNGALTALMNTDGITQHRGSVYKLKQPFNPKRTITAVCALSPAAVMRRPDTEIVFSFDMNKFARVIAGDYSPPQITKIINPSYEEALGYIHACHQAKVMSVDIEVIGMETACVGLAYKPSEAMCINFRDKDTNRYTVEQEYKLLRAFLKVADDPEVWTVAQNGNFDSYFMGYKDWACFPVRFDTLLAHHTLYPALPHNLGFLTAQYTDQPYYKDDKDVFREGGDIDAFWEYNCTDAAITLACAIKLKEELIEQGLWDFFSGHVAKMQPHLSYSTVTGVKVNQKAKARLADTLRAKLKHQDDELQNIVQTVLGDKNFWINPRSPKQLNELLFDRLGLRATRRSADANTREQLLNDPRVSPRHKEILIALNNYLKDAKFFSTYVETKIDPDGRYRSEYKQFGVQSAPGRLSSGQTLWGSGGNAQNQPSRAYELYQADDGCVFIYFDLAQAEARYVGWDANIEQWKEDFERARLEGDFDAHRSLAAAMYNKSYEDTAKKDIDENGAFTERYYAKRCRHGLNYRMHIARLAQSAGITYHEAATNYFKYHALNPELQIWWRAIEKEIKRTRMLFNSYGRRLLITQRLDAEGALDSIVAFRPQSTIGDKVQYVWRQAHEDSRWDMNKARIAINVHDALYGIATPQFAKTALSIMKEYAEQPILVRSIVTGKTDQLIIPADLKMSVPDEDGLHLMANMKDVAL